MPGRLRDRRCLGGSAAAAASSTPPREFTIERSIEIGALLESAANDGLELEDVSAAPARISNPSSCTLREGSCANDSPYHPDRSRLAAPRPRRAGAQLCPADRLLQHLRRHLRRPARLHAEDHRASWSTKTRAPHRTSWCRACSAKPRSPYEPQPSVKAKERRSRTTPPPRPRPRSRPATAPVALIVPQASARTPSRSVRRIERPRQIQLLNDASDMIAPQVVSGLLQKVAMTSMPADGRAGDASTPIATSAGSRRSSARRMDANLDAAAQAAKLRAARHRRASSSSDSGGGIDRGADARRGGRKQEKPDGLVLRGGHRRDVPAVHRQRLGRRRCSTRPRAARSTACSARVSP